MRLCALICTRNGKSRIGPVLDALFAQLGVNPDQFEILVVDNDSDDGSPAAIDNRLNGSPFPARRLNAPGRGKMAAFSVGLHSTTSDLVAVVDDDNVLGSDFISAAIELFSTRPEIGLLGSHNTPIFPPAHAKPAWFDALKGRYACGDPVIGPNGHHGVVAGAGSVFRRRALLDALDTGYVFINDTTRHGDFWITGEDTELCHLLNASGWITATDPRLQLDHIMSPERLTWSYARRLARTIGTGVVGVDPFYILSESQTTGLRAALRMTWEWQCLAKLRRLVRHRFALFHLVRQGREGDQQLIAMELDYGSLLRVLRERGVYSTHLRRTRAYLQNLPTRQNRSSSTG